MFRKIEKKFPRWKNGEITSPADSDYNCMAWAFEDNEKVWWPNISGYYWPRVANTVHDLAELQDYLLSEGWVLTDSAELIAGVRKVAVYAMGIQLKHVARQLQCGRWTSKLGDGQDISHDLNDIAGPWYGEVVAIYERPV